MPVRVYVTYHTFLLIDYRSTLLHSILLRYAYLYYVLTAFINYFYERVSCSELNKNATRMNILNISLLDRVQTLLYCPNNYKIVTATYKIPEKHGKKRERTDFSSCSTTISNTRSLVLSRMRWSSCSSGRSGLLRTE